MTFFGSETIFSAGRRLLVLLLALGAVLAGSTAVTLSWYQHEVLDEGQFVASASTLASDDAFRHDLVDSATQDVMASSEVEHYLGDGNSSGEIGGGWLGELAGKGKDWLRDRAQDFVHRALAQTADSSEFQSLWRQTAEDTHRADFGKDARGTVVLDVSPLYAAANAKIQSEAFVDLGLDEGTHLLEVEQKPEGAGQGQEAPVARVLHTGQDWAAALPAWTAVAVVLGLVAAALATRRRFLVLAAASAGTGILAWAQLVLGRQWVLGQAEKASGTEGLILKNLLRALTADVSGWALTALGAGAGAAVLFLLVHILLQGRHPSVERI